MKFLSLVISLETEAKELENILKESDREIYEDILIGTVGRKIRAKIHLAENWITKIKNLMESMETSSGLTLGLIWRPKKAEKEDELSTRALVDILMKDETILKSEDAEKIKRRYGSRLSFLNYKPEFYLKYMSDEPLSETRLKKLAGISDSTLLEIKKVMEREKYAMYQENMLEEYLKGLL